MNDLSFRMWLSLKTVSQKKPVNGESWVERFGMMQDFGVEVGRHWYKTNQGQCAFPQNMLVGQKAWIESHKCSNMTKVLSSLNCICATIICSDSRGSTVSDTGAIWQYIAIYSHSITQYWSYFSTIYSSESSHSVSLRRDGGLFGRRCAVQPPFAGERLVYIPHHRRGGVPSVLQEVAHLNARSVKPLDSVDAPSGGSDWQIDCWIMFGYC